MVTKTEITPAGKSTYNKFAVQWLDEVLLMSVCFFKGIRESFVVVLGIKFSAARKLVVNQSLVLCINIYIENRQLRQAQNL